ncbi:MAG: hypothetical protein R3E42_07040 [Burkholderiaceae bacterium]
MSENTYIRHHLVKGPDDVAGWPTEWVYGLFISGYLLLVVASLIVTTATALLAVKGRVPGAWLALSGLALGWLFSLSEFLRIHARPIVQLGGRWCLWRMRIDEFAGLCAHGDALAWVNAQT